MHDALWHNKRMSDSDDPKPYGMSGLMQSIGAAHTAGTSAILSILEMQQRQLADMARAGVDTFEMQVNLLLTMTNPKMLQSSNAARHYAIAKHYMPDDILARMPALMQWVLAHYGVTVQRMREMGEEEYIVNLLEMVGHYYATFEHGKLFEDKYNHKILAEGADGSINAENPDDIVRLFQRSGPDGEKPKDYPRIVWTASHANAESEEDVTRITHGIEALARDSWNGEKLKLASGVADAAPGKTLILFGNDTKENALLNGAHLTRRVRELRAHVEKGEPDNFEYMSPGAKRLSRLMLACMCENYFGPNGERLFDINDQRPLNEIFAEGGQIHLSRDARRIAQHFQMFGYSKGGNVVSDAMRFLQRDLMTLDSHDKAMVWMRNDDDKLHDIVQDKEFGVRSLLRNINICSVAAREQPLTEAQKENGLRRVAFNNTHDKLTDMYFYKSRPNDEFYVVQGVERKVGHDPADAMGDRGNPGYVLKDEDVERRMKEFFAPHHGKAAIANLFLEDGKVKMESAPGTADYTMMSSQHVFIEALQKAGLTNPRLIPNDYHIGVVEIESDDKLATNPEALRKLKVAFTDLRQNAKGLLIAEKILKRDVDRMVRIAQGKPVDDSGFGKAA